MVRAIGPKTEMPDHPSGRVGWAITSTEGRKPTIPHSAAGIRSEPPVSEPVHRGRRLAANAAADPPEEPPAIKLASKGLPVAPHTGFRLFPPAPISGTFVLARIMAPAARRRATIGRSAPGMWLRARMLPWVVSSPWVSCKSFTPMGNPSSTPRGVPACHLCVAASAQAVARVTSIAVKALILGLDREISSRHAARYLVGVKVLASKAARTSHAESATRSALLNGSYQES